MTQLTTVKLDLIDQIRTMICVSLGFRCSLLFLALFVASQTLARPFSSKATKQCNNVYNEIKTLLQEMKKQHTQMQNDINILKGKRTGVKGNYKKRCLVDVLKILGSLSTDLTRR